MKYIKVVSGMSLIALVSVGATIVWSRGHRRTPATAERPVSPQPSTRLESEPRLFLLPTEPQAPEKGTAGRRIYLGAMIAGEERGLATVRKALSESQGPIRRGNEARGDARSTSSSPTGAESVRQLRLLERSYTERLERHRLELAAEP